VRSAREPPRSGLEARGDVRRAGFGALSMLGFFFARRWGRKRSAR
jgi:hypothetical protein